MGLFKPRCTSEKGQHTWGKWETYAHSWQRRRCAVCGYFQEKSL